MKLYWPCGTRLTESGPEPVTTYDAVMTLGDARKQIAMWRDWYKFHLTEAHIDVYEKTNKTQIIYIDPETDAIIRTEDISY